jgi:hypothetical protein
MAASGSAGNFQSVPVLSPDQAPIPTTRGSVNMYLNTEDNLSLYTVDTFKVHRKIGPAPTPTDYSVNAEVATITLNPDGSGFTLGGSPYDTILRFQLNSSSAWIVGDTVTNSTTGATGVIITKIGNANTPRFSLNTLTPGDWNTGDSLTNGTVVKNMDNPGSWLITVPTLKRTKLVLMTSVDPNNTDNNSFGKDSFTSKDCIFNSNSISSVSTAESIMISSDYVGGGAGWSGFTTGVAGNTSYNLIFVHSGNIATTGIDGVVKLTMITQ